MTLSKMSSSLLFFEKRGKYKVTIINQMAERSILHLNDFYMYK